MPRVLVLFAHPRLERSRTNRALLKALPVSDRITLRDLYELYPDMQVDVQVEQDLLHAHDVVVLHHPFYWYSVPPLLKQYIDLVYAFGWAYGPGGTALRGKVQFHVVTTGGGPEAYTADGFHGHTLAEFLLPLKRTATLCGMHWAPPFAAQGTHRVGDAELERIAHRYGRMLHGWADGTLTLDRMAGTTDQHHLLNTIP